MFFTRTEILNIQSAMEKIEGIGINIRAFREHFTEKHGEMERVDIQERSFKGLAKLWKVVQEIIALVFIDKLVAGRLSLRDSDGNLYGVVLTERRVARPASLWPLEGE